MFIIIHLSMGELFFKCDCPFDLFLVGLDLLGSSLLVFHVHVHVVVGGGLSGLLCLHVLHAPKQVPHVNKRPADRSDGFAVVYHRLVSKDVDADPDDGKGYE